MLLSKNNKNQQFSLTGFIHAFFLILTVIFILIEIRNGRYWQSDFEVYFKSAHRALLGENLYRPEEDGFYHYKYAPFAAYLFMPYLVLSFAKVKFFYSLTLSVLMASSYLFLFKKINKNLEIDNTANKHNLVFFLLTLLPLVVFFVRELHLGQVNTVLLFLYISSFSLLEYRPKFALTLLAISGFLKPYFIIFLVYFLYKNKWKYFFYTLIAFLLLGLIPLLTYKIPNLVNQYVLWFNEIKIEWMQKTVFSNTANLTIFSLFDKYFSLSTLFPSTFSYQLFITFCCALFVILFLNKTEKNLSADVKLFYDFSLLCAFVPLLTCTDKNAYIMLLPITIYIVAHFTKTSYFKIFAFVIASIFIAWDVGDTDKYTGWMTDFYLVPVGVLIFFGLFVSSIKETRNSIK